MSDLHVMVELAEARDAWDNYTRKMHRLIGCMAVCWLAGVPLIMYAPIMLVVSAPAAVTSGIVAWWTYWDARHGHETAFEKNHWGDREPYRPRIPGPRERLSAAETAYRKAMT